MGVMKRESRHLKGLAPSYWVASKESKAQALPLRKVGSAT